MVGERGFEPPTPWSRKRKQLQDQQLTILSGGASTGNRHLILESDFHSDTNGCPIPGAPVDGHSSG